MQRFENRILLRVFLLVGAAIVSACGLSLSGNSGILADSGTDGNDQKDADTDTDTEPDTLKDTETEQDTDWEIPTDGDAGTYLMTLSGTVKRDGPHAYVGENGGIGTLCLTVASRCPDSNSSVPGTLPKRYAKASFFLENADFSDKANQVPFEMSFPRTYLSNGEYAIAAFLQEAGGPCSANGPGSNDPITYTNWVVFDGVGCARFASVNGADVSGLEVILNYINFPGVKWLE